MPSHTEGGYKSGITHFYWWAVYQLAKPLLPLARLAVGCGRLARRGGRWLLEQWGDLMLAPHDAATKAMIAARWLILTLSVVVVLATLITVVASA